MTENIIKSFRAFFNFVVDIKRDIQCFLKYNMVIEMN